jgi:biotin synthase
MVPRAPQQVLSPAAQAAISSSNGELRFNWTKEEIQAIYDSPIMDLLFQAVSVSPLLRYGFRYQFPFSISAIRI